VSTIAGVLVQEAKDFLVQQTEEQAQLEGLPLAELEKRMMYFTEGPDAIENPIMLNAEFEEHFNTSEYETKIAKLLRHAHKRIKQDDENKASKWKESVKKLKEGDHYLILLLEMVPTSDHPKRDFVLQVGIGVLIVFLIVAGVFVKSWLFDK
jgi:hypothetical protein